ncbi:TPA: adenosylcobalamin-dependent ribonucleoside-diphosphate reductase [Clostridium perfringens]
MQIKNEVLYNIWADRYRKNGETIDENIRRVAKHIGNNEIEQEEFYNVMDKGLFLPAGRTMSNSGIGKSLTLNNCFVLNSVEDSIDDIFDKVKMGAITQKAGGGTGYDFSKIRPNGSETSNDAIASGVVSFMDVFNSQTSCILQGGRRGANMGVLNVRHPDIKEFLHAKSYDANKLVHFNVSVMVDNDFMKAVENDEEFTLHYPVYDNKGYIIKNPNKWTHTKKIKAKELWDEIMQKAYDNGEPGIFFYENLNKDNNTYYMENIICTNPCAEFLSGLLFDNTEMDSSNYKGACNLGSIFLNKFVLDPFTSKARIDYENLDKTINVAVRFLDNIIDKNKFPHKHYENYQKTLRTIGLGISGLADMFTMLNIVYGSEESVKLTDELMNYITSKAYLCSTLLAKEKGSFKGFKKKEYIKSGFIQKHLQANYKGWDEVVENIKRYGMRNARLISIAPTGTLSLTFGNNCSSGLEPIFSLEYDRKVKMGGQSEDNIHIVKMQDDAYRLWKENTSEDNIVDEKVFVTAMNLSVDEHINILKTIAYHTDMSCSKTVNVPTDYPFEKCKDLYVKAWKNGIKGLTIFRPNEIRQGVLLSETNKKDDNNEEKEIKLERGFIKSCSDELIGRKKKLMTGCGSLHIQVWAEEKTGDIMEVFLSKGSSGGCFGYMNGLSRMISVALRGGISIDDVCDQLTSVMACPSYTGRKLTHKDTSKGNSCPVAIGFVLKEIQKELWDELKIKKSGEKITIKTEKVEKNTMLTKEEQVFLKENGEVAFANKYKKCPTCGEKLEFSSGCLTCKGCGFSKC